MHELSEYNKEALRKYKAERKFIEEIISKNNSTLNSMVSEKEFDYYVTKRLWEIIQNNKDKGKIYSNVDKTIIEENLINLKKQLNIKFGLGKKAGILKQKFKQKVRERSKGFCEIDSCKRKINSFNSEIHHIIPKNFGGTNELNNLVVLCKDCHNKESIWQRKFQEEFIKTFIDLYFSPQENPTILEDKLTNISQKFIDKIFKSEPFRKIYLSDKKIVEIPIFNGVMIYGRKEALDF